MFHPVTCRRPPGLLTFVLWMWLLRLELPGHRAHCPVSPGPMPGLAQTWEPPWGFIKPTDVVSYGGQGFSILWVSDPWLPSAALCQVRMRICRLRDGSDGPCLSPHREGRGIRCPLSFPHTCLTSGARGGSLAGSWGPMCPWCPWGEAGRPGS